jgi:hypothetical protein
MEWMNTDIWNEYRYMEWIQIYGMIKNKSMRNKMSMRMVLLIVEMNEIKNKLIRTKEW